MRIAIVINTSWNIYNFRKGLILALLEKGHEVVAIAPTDEYSPKLKEIGCQFIPIKMSGTGANPLSDCRTLLQLRKTYKRVSPHVVLHYTIKPNIYGTLAASSLSIPCINNVSGLGTVFLDKGFASSVAKALYKLSFKKASLIFFQNPDDQKDFIDETGLININQDLLPGSGVDLKHFIPKEKSREGKFTFLMIARVIVEKGIYEYITAAKQLLKTNKNIEFQLIGSIEQKHSRGISKDEVDNWVSHGVVNYLGTKSDLRTHIAESDCIVLPSYREGTPKTLLEAAAMAKPIITTNTPGCREIVRDNYNGLLCEVKSADDLAAKLKSMVNMKPNSRNNLGLNGRKLVEERFDEKIVIDKYLEHISNIIIQRPKK